MPKKKPVSAKSGADSKPADSKPADSKPATPKSATPKSGADSDDALHQAFRAALERKNARHESHPGTGPDHLGVGDAHNDRQRRQFRRKSG